MDTITHIQAFLRSVSLQMETTIELIESKSEPVPIPPPLQTETAVLMEKKALELMEHVEKCTLE